MKSHSSGYNSKARRILALLLTVAVLFSTVGCSASSHHKAGDQDVLTITLPGRDMTYFLDKLEKTFPDIHFMIEQYEGVNGSEYLGGKLHHGDASDLFMYTHKIEDEDISDHLIDLSGYSFVTNFDRSILRTMDVDGRIYQIPGPVTVRCAAYNKTLFEEKGWEVPSDFDGLISLCRTIREDPDDITPIAMSLGAVGYAFTTVTTLSQAGFLSTPAGHKWAKAFKAGSASSADGFAEGLSMTSRLIDEGAFSPEKYIGIWDIDAAKLEFTKGKAAMFYVWGSQSGVYRALRDSEYDYGLLPFFGDDAGEEVIGVDLSSTWSIPKRLTESGNEKKLANALRVLEWIASPEGQESLRNYTADEAGNMIPDTAALINLRDYTSDVTEPYLRELRLSYPGAKREFMLYNGYEGIIVDTGTIVQDAMLAGDSSGMVENFIREGDRLEYAAAQTPREGIAIGSIASDFTEEETAQLLANIIVMEDYGDFALVSCAGRGDHGIRNRSGAAGKLYEGDMFNGNYNTIVSTGGQTLEVLEITGREAKRLLSYGKTIVSDTNKLETAVFRYYWSGIDVVMKGGEISSVICGGQELKNNEVYRVVVTKGDYPEALADCAVPIEGAGTVSEIWMEYLTENSPVGPPIVTRK